MFQSFEPKNQKEIFTAYTHKGEILRGILSIPHSGEIIPKEFESFLTQDLWAIGQDVDFQVNQLVDIEKLTDAGICVIVAHIHRVAVDLNRSPELAVLNWKKNTQGIELVKSEPDELLREELLGRYYHPYYHVLKSMLEEGLRIKNPFPFVDLHSMPSRPTNYHLKQNPQQKTHRPDFCLSNRHGKTSTKDYLDFMQKKLESQSYEVWSNDPYIGGYITEWVGTKFSTQMMQIEIKRQVYMNEAKRELEDKKVDQLKGPLTTYLIELFHHFGPA